MYAPGCPCFDDQISATMEQVRRDPELFLEQSGRNVAENRESALSWFARGVALHQLGRHGEWHSAMQRAIALDRRFAPVCESWARADLLDGTEDSRAPVACPYRAHAFRRPACSESCDPHAKPCRGPARGSAHRIHH
jgi:hypothetical protein